MTRRLLAPAGVALAGVGATYVWLADDTASQAAKAHSLEHGILCPFGSSTDSASDEKRGWLQWLRLRKRPTSEAKHKPTVLVIGAGVTGVSTAYTFARAGYRVAVVEAREGPGSECSAVSAGGMQRSNPLVDRSMWVSVVSGLFQGLNPFLTSQSPFQFFHINWLTALTDPHFWAWASAFSYNSLLEPEAQRERQRHMLSFTSWAIDRLEAVLLSEADGGKLAKACGYSRSGALSVSSDDDASRAATSEPRTSNSQEMEQVIESTEELLRIEPSLRHCATPPTSGVLQPEAAMADSERFTHHLARICKDELGVEFYYGFRVLGFERAPALPPASTPSSPTAADAADVDPVSSSSGSVEAGSVDAGSARITAVHTSQGMLELEPDTKVVLAAGSWTPRIAALADIYVPVYPLKGYSITLNVPETAKRDAGFGLLPSRIVSDKYMYLSRLGDQVRIASIGEVAGWLTTPSPFVDMTFRAKVSQYVPQLQELVNAVPTRCGLRPFTADGIILVGKTPVPNLHLIVGPGFNGWKTAIGAAEVLRDLVSETSVELNDHAQRFDSHALSPEGNVTMSPVFTKFTRTLWNDVTMA